MSPDSARAGRLRAELGDLSNVVERAKALASKARERGYAMLRRDLEVFCSFLESLE